MTIDYENITQEELEEKIEFVDWSLVPYKLITQEVKEKFKDIKELNLRVHLEDLISTMEIKMDIIRGPNKIFFSVNDEIFMRLILKHSSNNILEIAFEDISSKFNYNFKINDSLIAFSVFFRNILLPYFKNCKLGFSINNTILSQWMESHIRDLDFEILFRIGVPFPSSFHSLLNKLTSKTTETTWSSKFL